jgi:Tol biopolymer transport system component
MNYDGTNKIQLTFDKEDNNNPCISNDGKLLIYETQTYINRYPSGGVMYDYSVINILDLKTKNISKIADENQWCSQPNLSSDKQFLVFCSHKDDHGSSIVLSDINGNKFTILTDYGPHRNPMFTPQCDKIIYVSDHDQKTNIYKIDLDGKNKQQLTDSEWNINPTFSPDGSKILWESYWDIFLMNTDGSNKINLSNNNSIFARTPSYSHSGDKIVFITERTYSVPIEESVREIHLIDLNTQERKIILKTGINFEPKFFHDDSKIIFSQYENYQFYICTINIDGSGYLRLGKGGNSCVY